MAEVSREPTRTMIPLKHLQERNQCPTSPPQPATYIGMGFTWKCWNACSGAGNNLMNQLSQSDKQLNRLMELL